MTHLNLTHTWKILWKKQRSDDNTSTDEHTHIEFPKPKVIVLQSNPLNCTNPHFHEFNLQREKVALQEVFEKHSVKCHFSILKETTLAEAFKRYDIVHISGHGSLESAAMLGETSDPGLNKLEYISAQAVTKALKGKDVLSVNSLYLCLRLFFFALCLCVCVAMLRLF